MTTRTRAVRALLASRLLALPLLALVLAPLGCGSVGPTTRTEQPVAREAFRGARCEPDLVLECEAVCVAGDWTACEAAGIGYLSGEHVTQDLPRASLLLRRSCEQGHALACSAHAKMALDKQAGVELDSDAILQHLDVGCVAGDMNACVRQGNLIQANSATPSTFEQATQLWEKGCAGGEPGGCFQLGLSAKTGRQGAVQNEARALKLLGQACDGRVGQACFDLAQLQLSPGRSAVLATDGARNLQRACSLSYQPACGLVASMYQFGKGVTQDVSKARLLHNQACQASLVDSCVSLAELSPDDPKEQLRLFTKGCDAKIASACLQQARLLEAQNSAKNATDEQQVAAQEAYQVACDKGIPQACGKLGLRLSTLVSLKRRVEAAKLLGIGCNTGEMPEACLKLGTWLAAGEPIPRDGARAAQLLGPLCVKRIGAACFALGRVTQFGYGVPANANGAASLYTSGCEAGHQPACLARAEQQWLGIDGIQKVPPSAVAVFKSQCTEKVSDACMDLGYAYQQGVGIARDLERARELFDAECKAGRQTGCAYLANLSAISRGTDREKGQAQLASACDSASGKACWFLSELATVKPSERAAALQRACILEVPEACSVLKLSR